MQLAVDNSENKILSAQTGVTFPRRRQNLNTPLNFAVLVYIGGMENSAMFNGCIKFPFLARFVVKK